MPHLRIFGMEFENKKTKDAIFKISTLEVVGL